MPVKSSRPVYPLIRNGNWPLLSQTWHQPLVTIKQHTALAIVFAQDGEEQPVYLTRDIVQHTLKESFRQWQQHIHDYPFEIELSARLENRVLFVSGGVYVTGKILSAGFLELAAEILQTDRLLISIPGRSYLMVTGFCEDFHLLEMFFRLHFHTWQGMAEHTDEQITDMLFIANHNRLQYAVPPSFHAGLFEKAHMVATHDFPADNIPGAYPTFSLQEMMEHAKIPVHLPA